MITGKLTNTHLSVARLPANSPTPIFLWQDYKQTHPHPPSCGKITGKLTNTHLSVARLQANSPTPTFLWHDYR
jgi:hypothetical protein